jgi:tetratricopeptide (TPR) repeat protein
VALLEASIRLDPARAYAYNALGIAWLQQLPPNANRAQAAFEDAIRFAPYWAYPQHNMALLYAALGNYELAFQTLERALRLAPLYSYLPYTLGLLNQQLNRSDEAERYYREALDTAQRLRDHGKDRRVPGRWPERAEILNALGTLAEQAGRARRAVAFYREAIAADPATTGARLNLADKLSEAGKASPEAEALWHALIAQDARLLAPRLKFGGYLARLGRIDEAAVQYEFAVQLAPFYFDGRITLVRLLQKAGKIASALNALQPAVLLAGENASQTETLGDVYVALGSHAEALGAWRRAQTLVEREPDSTWRRDSRKRLKAKIGQLSGQ